MPTSASELFIVDNSDSEWKVRNYLADWCELSKTIDIATGYFEIGAFLALKDKWQQVDSIRLLMLVSTPSSAAVSWLALRQVESEQTFLTTIEAIYPQYRANFLAWAPYFYDCVTNADRRRAIRHAEKDHGLSDDTLQCIRHDYALRTHNGE
jgi:hypothetical protein